MADAPAATKSPNRPVVWLLLLLTLVGTIGLVVWGMLEFYEEKRLSGSGYVSLGLLWFMFWSWAARAAARPGPSG